MIWDEAFDEDMGSRGTEVSKKRTKTRLNQGKWEKNINQFKWEQSQKVD